MVFLKPLALLFSGLTRVVLVFTVVIPNRCGAGGSVIYHADAAQGGHNEPKV